jgi:hypothetical protein
MTAPTLSNEYVIREVEFRAEIHGVTPLLMNNPASMSMSADAKAKGKKSIPTPDEEAAAKAYRLPSGDLCMPTVMLFQSMIEAGKLLNDPDNPRRRISYKIAAALFPPAAEGFPLLNGKGKPLRDYAIDVRRAVVQGSGIQRARPRIEIPWSVKFAMGFDADLVSGDVLYMVLATAGKQVGVMDYRPQKKGPYGRFQVDSFDVVGE